MATTEEHLMDWLRDAHAMEKQAIESIENQIDRLKSYPQLQSWVRDHVDASRRQRELIETCIKRRGGNVSTLKDIAMGLFGNIQEATSLFMQDEVLKNVIADYAFKHYEIASYTSLRSAAEAAADAETTRVCDDILREEEALAGRLLPLLPEVTLQYLNRDLAGSSAKR